MEPMPGRTATELAAEAGRALPALAADLDQGVRTFADVTYGERPGTPEAYAAADRPRHGGPRGEGGPAMTSTTPTITERWRSWRGVLGAAGLIVVAAVLIVLVSGVRNGGRLDIEATSPTGARALAELLRDQGVTVTQVTTFEDAVARADGSLLVVARPEFLVDPAELAELAGRPGARLLIAPTPTVLRALAPGTTARPGTAETVRQPRCDLRTRPCLAGDALVGGSVVRRRELLRRHGLGRRRRHPRRVGDVHDQRETGRGRQRRAGDEPGGHPPKGHLVRAALPARHARRRREADRRADPGQRRAGSSGR